MKKLLGWIWRHKRRTALYCLTGLSLLLLVGLAVGWSVKEYLDRRIFAGYDPRKGNAAGTVTRQCKAGYAVIEFTFRSQETGRDVPVVGVIPDRPARTPAVLFLYGVGMNNDFIRHYARDFAAAGLAVFSMDHYDCGKRRGEMKIPSLSPAMKLLKQPVYQEQLAREWAGFRYRNACAVTETRQLIDVVEKMPEINPDRIYAWGLSLGVIVSCNAGSMDHRLKKFVLTEGCGDFPRFARETPILQWFPSVTRPVFPFLAYMIEPLDPIRRFGRLSPRPILFQTSSNDDLVPKNCSAALFAAAGTPKSQTFYAMGHMKPDHAMVRQSMLDGIKWLAADRRTD